jgi:glycosyltransferase involved in cell wall biosynthesis
MKVSVIIPVYNAASFVRQAVESALEQNETAEVLLVEDCSPDRSLEVCERLALKYEKVRLLRHPEGKNRGAGASRNLGIRYAKFDYIAFLDADDFYLPGRFSPASHIFEHAPAADGVYDAVSVHFEDETARKTWFSRRAYGQLTEYSLQREVPPEQLLEALAVGGLGAFCTDGIVVKRSLFERTGLFDEGIRHEDTVMWIKMAAVGTLLPGRLDEPVSCYRVHSANRWIRNSPDKLYWRKAGIAKLNDWARRNRISRDKKSLLLLMHMMADIGPYHDASSPIKALVAFHSFVRNVATYSSAPLSSNFWSNLFGVARQSFGSSSHLNGGS